MAKTQHVGLDEIVGYFDELEDPRSDINQKHPLVSGLASDWCVYASTLDAPYIYYIYFFRRKIQNSATMADLEIRRNLCFVPIFRLPEYLHTTGVSWRDTS